MPLMQYTPHLKVSKEVHGAEGKRLGVKAKGSMFKVLLEGYSVSVYVGLCVFS